MNESQRADIAGDVSVFRSIVDAKRYVEPVDVVNKEYSGYLVDGTCLTLSVRDEEVSIEADSGQPKDPSLVRLLLEHAAAATFHSGPKVDVTQLPIAKLIELTGFTR